MTTIKESEDVQTSITNLDMSLDDLIENDSRFKCIFSSALVTVTERADPSNIHEENPIKYCTNLEHTFSEIKKNFDSSLTRENFLRETISDQINLTSLETKVNAHMDLELLKTIPLEHIKGIKRLKIDNVEFDIPMINNEQLTMYIPQFELINNLLLDQIYGDYIIRNHCINKTETLANLKIRMERLTSQYARDPIRKQLVTLMSTALILSSIQRGIFNNNQKWLKMTTQLDDEITGGMFITDTSGFTTKRSGSMIEHTSLGVELKIVYNLNHQQLLYLVSWLFSSDKYERTRAKIELLASAKGSIRNDIALNPENVFIHSLREYFMTREESVDLILYHYDKTSSQITRRCPLCRTIIINVRGTILVHHYCDVIAWMVKNLGCEYQGAQLIIPKYTYLAPGIANYARQAYKTKGKTMSEPFIGKSQTEFVAYSVNNDGRPMKLCHQGIKTVKLDQSSTMRH